MKLILTTVAFYPFWTSKPIQSIKTWWSRGPLYKMPVKQKNTLIRFLACTS